MKLKATFIALFACAFSYGLFAQACCVGPGVSYPNGSTTAFSYTAVETTGSTTISGVGDPNVIYMGGVGSTSVSTGTSYAGEYTSSDFYPSKSCCQGPATTYPTGNTATVTSYNTGGSSSSSSYVGVGDPNVIYMGGVGSTSTSTYIEPLTVSDVGNSCCGGPGISYPNGSK